MIDSLTDRVRPVPLRKKSVRMEQWETAEKAKKEANEVAAEAVRAEKRAFAQENGPVGFTGVKKPKSLKAPK